MSKVSIIVTVYNGEPYIKRCVNSLCQQTHSDIQMIFVDDGSTDRSLSLLHQFAEQDQRIEIYSMEKNSGLAHARNEGLRHVNGDYVGTLDIDDWLAADALEQCSTVLDQHPETDCVLFRLILVEADGSEHDFPMKPFTVISGKEAMKRSLNWQTLHGWYLIRRELHLKYPFDTTTRVYSDENTTRIHFQASREVRCCNGIYYYWQNPESITHKVSLSHYDQLRALESLRQQLIAMNVDKETRQSLAVKLWRGIVDCYYYYFMHRNDYAPHESNFALSEIKRSWQQAPTKEIPLCQLIKPGYWPLKWSWQLFCWQEEIYFLLRKWLKGA